MVANRLVEVDWVMIEFKPVKMLPTLREVVVALVPVALVKVRVVTFPLVEKRSVLVACVIIEEVADSEPTVCREKELAKVFAPKVIAPV